MARKRQLAGDVKGRFRPHVGWYIAEDGERRQKRFNLGTDRREAERRYHRIHDLYSDDTRESGNDCWSLRALRFAEQIAAGIAVIQIPPPPPEDKGALVEYQQGIEHFRQYYPSLDFMPSDPNAYQQSATINARYVSDRLAELEAQLKRMGALIAEQSLPEKMIDGRFHEALDRYIAEIRRDSPRVNGEINQTGRKRVEKVERIKSHHADCPLHELNRDKVMEIAAYWRNRPNTKRGKQCAFDTARNQLDEIGRFLKWLETSTYGWTLPKGVTGISRKGIVRFPEEKKLSAIVKTVYTPDQLAIINGTATNRERLALYLGLNCAMGASELGHLLVSDFALNEIHPYAKTLGIASSNADSWLRCFRNKTSVFGEWRLWNETVDMVRWATGRAIAIGSEHLFCRETGKPLFDPASKKPDAGFANMWTLAVARAQKVDPTLPKLAFGTLRDTLPNYLRTHHDTELASICLAHGNPSRDTLIECYANRPFGRLHVAMKAARDFFAPVFVRHQTPVEESAKRA